MRVVHIATSMYGGAGRAAYRIHEAILKNGVSSAFLSFESKYFKEWNEELIRLNSLRRLSIFQREKNRIEFRLRKHFGLEFNTVKRMEREFIILRPKLNSEIASLPFSNYDVLDIPIVRNADIIHLHWVAGILDYPKFLKNNKKPVLWTLHDMNPFQGIFHYKDDEKRNVILAGKFDRKIYAIKEKAIHNRKTNLAIVSPSHWLLNEALNSDLFHDIQGNCIQYPLNTMVFSPNINSKFRFENKIPENNTVLLFVAERVSNHRKGLDLLIEALKSITQFQITLLVLGDSDDICLKGIDFRKLGSIKDNEKLAYYYSNSDAFILPSREDNLPNVMLEALACGTPVIGFSIGGLTKHITEFETGLLAKSLDSDSLKTIIESFCANKERFDRKEIRNYAKKQFDEKLIAEKYIKVYSELLN